MSNSINLKTMISWIIPTFNEEETIERTVSETVKVVGENIEIIISDDGSTDSTVHVCKNIPFVKIIKNKHHGRGAAILSALRHVKGEIIVLSSADIIIYEKDFYEFMEKIKDCDLVMLSKKHPNSEIINRGKLRTFFSMFFILSVRILFGLKYTDTQGVKVLKKKLVEPIISTCSEKEYLFDLEIVLLAKRQGFKIQEIPMKIVDRGNNKILVKIPYFVSGLLKIWGKDRNGHYEN